MDDELVGASARVSQSCIQRPRKPLGTWFLRGLLVPICLVIGIVATWCDHAGAATPTLTAIVLDQSGVNVTGQQVPLLATQAQATLTNPEGGSVTFQLYQRSFVCAGKLLSTIAEGVAVNGFVPPTPLTIQYATGRESYSFRVSYGDSSTCVPFYRDCSGNYWVWHPVVTAADLATKPEAVGFDVVSTWEKAEPILTQKPCPDTLANCLAQRVLVAELDLTVGSPPSIAPYVMESTALLASVGWHGVGTYTLTPTEATDAHTWGTLIFDWEDHGTFPGE
jgi:hypothetical protein